jgi:hypothetical protein
MNSAAPCSAGFPPRDPAGQVAAGGGSILPRAVLAAREAGLRVALEQEPPEDGGAEGEVDGEVERLRRELPPGSARGLQVSLGTNRRMD